MRWLRDGFCQEEKRKAKEIGEDPYNLMNAEAAKIPAGSYGMICCFSDVMNFINWKHSSPTFTNFELIPEKFNKYTFYRAILENTAMLVKGHIELVKEATGNEPEKLIFAGGASVSELWSQILADVTGKTVVTPVVKEATALGAAILAGYGVGIYPSIAEGAKICAKVDKTFTPNLENKKVYDEMYPVWREVYKANLDLCDRKLTKNMWIAPGL
jgi:autoinducer 2 (AI-2) kinase